MFYFLMKIRVLQTFPPPKMNLIPGFGRIGKKAWKLFPQCLISFPSSFFLGIVTPLYLAYLDLLVLRNSFGCL
jgi:hypothetical protein